MESGFLGRINRFFNQSNALTILVVINVAFFLLYRVSGVIFYLSGSSSAFHANLLQWLAVPASLKNLLFQPWSLFSYMFVHTEFFHIFFNMLWLYWMGMLFTEYLGDKKLVSTYIMGGLCGAILYILAFNLFPPFKPELNRAYTIGASAGVMAIIVGIATLIPDFELNLLLFGKVKLKYVAVVYVILDVIGISEGNAGGHFAHLGGALYGFIYIRQMRAGRDIGSGITSLLDRIRSLFTRETIKVAYRSDGKRRPLSDDEFAVQKKYKQEIIDGILDKISQSGYDSLTRKEKELLFRISKEEKE